MDQLQGKVAVVTGAASGIGRALADAFVAEGMRVVLADIERAALDRTAAELEPGGGEILAVETDVADGASVRALADRAYERFGAVHVLCNNAGVFAGGLTWEAPDADWAWVFGVNVHGIVHGLQAFVPRMLAGGEPGHIVNTCSMAAVTSSPFAGPYYASKHAALAVSETLYHELTVRGAPIGVSALCPELIATRIGLSERNRPAHLQRRGPEGASPERELVESSLRELTQGHGYPPAVIATRVVEAIRANRFYVLAEDAWRDACNTRLEDIRLARNPSHVVPQTNG